MKANVTDGSKATILSYLLAKLSAALPVLVLVIGLVLYYLLQNDLGLMTRMIGMSLFTISLYLVVGIGGVATLGHAIVYGAGAYVAGYCAVHYVQDPLILLLIGICAGAVAGAISGMLILHARGLPQMVLSIALVELAREGANKAQWLTGGSDGLTGISPDPVFGRFAFDIFGHTGYLLGLCLLVIVLFLVARISASPFGLACRAIAADEGRVRAMGINVYWNLMKLFIISGAIGGCGGAYVALATGVVGLDSLSFERSAEGLVMLVLGGTNSLAGAVIGTVLYITFEHITSAASPFHWLMIVGLLLVFVALGIPKQIIRPFVRWRPRRTTSDGSVVKL